MRPTIEIDTQRAAGAREIQVLELQGEFEGIDRMEMSLEGVRLDLPSSFLAGRVEAYGSRRLVIERYSDAGGAPKFRVLGEVGDRLVFDRPPRYAPKTRAPARTPKKKQKLIWP